MNYIGIDIGGTKCAVSLGKLTDGRWKVFAKQKIPTAGRNPGKVLDELMYVLDCLTEKENMEYEEFEAIGISCGGPLDSQAGIIMSPPNLPGWDDVHITEFFSESTGLPCYLQNDANACAVAEWLYGAGKGSGNMIFMTFGTGLGAGLILDGKLYSGASDMAGEIGHIRMADEGPVGYGKAGSFEGFCSGGGIAQLGAAAAKECAAQGRPCRLLEIAGSYENITAKLIGDMADEGDGLCLDVYRKSGEMLGRGLSVLIDVLNPEKVIIGGVYAKSSHLLLPYAQAVIEKEALAMSRRVCEILPCGLGDSDDVLIAVSTSGNSRNCVYAAITAKAMGIKVIALTGIGGGRLADIADVTVNVPEKETYKVQEYHLPVYHCLCAMLEEELY